MSKWDRLKRTRKRESGVGGELEIVWETRVF